MRYKHFDEIFYPQTLAIDESLTSRNWNFNIKCTFTVNEQYLCFDIDT